MEFNFVSLMALNRICSPKKTVFKEPPFWLDARSLRIKLNDSFVSRLNSEHIKHKGFNRSYIER